MGDRLILRELQLEDWPDVHAYGSDPEAVRYQPWGPNTEDESKAFVERVLASAQEEPRVFYSLAAVLRNEGDVIGNGSLRIEEQRQGEIGYFINRNYWGRGYATEVGNLLLAFGFTELGLHRIFGTCDPRNKASAHVMEKIGMIYEGRLRHTMLIRDGWRDSDVYSIVEDEWRQE